MTDVLIKIVDVVQSDICVDPEDGQHLYNRIAENIEAGHIVLLSFAGVARITTAFLNAAVGQLYNEFSEDKIRIHVKPKDAENWHLTRLKKVVDGAKSYFSNPDKFNNATNVVIESSDG